MRKLFVVLLNALLLAGGWYMASPWWAMKGLVDDARAGDLAGLEQRIDFARVRENARKDVRAAIARQSGGEGLLGGVGDAFAGRIADGAIDNLVTPEGMALMVAGGAVAGPLVPERLRSQELGWHVERKGLHAFHAVSTFADGEPGPVLTFARDGLGWDMVGVSLELQR